jgi:two-component system, LytTR family, sensor kinase
MFAHRLRYLFIGLLAAYSFVNVWVLDTFTAYAVRVPLGWVFGLMLAVIGLIWEANRLLDGWVASRWPRIDRTRIGWQFGLSLGLTAVLTLGPTLAVAARFMPANGAALAGPLKLMLAFGFRINLFLNILNIVFAYTQQLRRLQTEAETFRRQTAQAQLQSLKNQINPHFLFNSLSVLATLTERNPPAAVTFIQEFARVYRYVIQQHEKELVAVHEELQFIDSYLYLLRQRFEDNLTVSVRVSEPARGAFVVPVALQMLIENAVKHNVASRQWPLHIVIFDEPGGWLTVQNNRRPKDLIEPSTRVGLSNIRQRYRFVTDRDVQTLVTDAEFIVRLPLLIVTPSSSTVHERTYPGR